MHWKLQKLFDTFILILMLVLDIRDLYYKTQWLGPSDAYVFTTKTSFLFDNISNENKSPSGSLTGWRIFHDSCDLQAFPHDNKRQSSHFQYLNVLATNCSAPDGLIEEMRPHFSTMFLTSDIRVDAMAFAACQLLYISRRPPLCQDAMVTNFLLRYRLDSPKVTNSMMASPMSAAERELRSLLDVIGTSIPLSRVVCVGGVEFHEQSNDVSLRPIFGCAGPDISIKTVAFVGHFATSFDALQMNKAHLMADDIEFFGLHFLFRQNAIRSYKYLLSKSKRPDMEFVQRKIEVTTSLNMSCSGFLYNFMIVLDVVLLIVHFWTSLELFEHLIRSPLLQKLTKKEMEDQGHVTLLAHSLVHSTPVAILTTVSALLSWLLLYPHTAVWDLSHEKTSLSSVEIHTLLSGLQVWILLLQLVHVVWGFFVFLDEGRAYMLATRTYISSIELVAAIIMAGYLLHSRLLLILPTKHILEHQQAVDSAAFPGHMTISNAFEDNAHLLPIRGCSSGLWMVYTPLFELLLLSFLFATIGLITRYLYHRRKAKHGSTAVVGVDESEPQSSQTPTRTEFSSAQAAMAGYKRLPLEELLNIPIRSKDIVRNGAPNSLEKTVGDEQYLWSVQCLAHGLLLESNRFLSTRRGFYHILPVRELMDRQSNENQNVETNGSPKRRRYTLNLH